MIELDGNSLFRIFFLGRKEILSIVNSEFGSIFYAELENMFRIFIARTDRVKIDDLINSDEVLAMIQRSMSQWILRRMKMIALSIVGLHRFSGCQFKFVSQFLLPRVGSKEKFDLQMVRCPCQSLRRHVV